MGVHQQEKLEADNNNMFDAQKPGVKLNAKTAYSDEGKLFCQSI